MNAEETEEAITCVLSEIFGDGLVERQWSIGKGATDAFRRDRNYLPCLDIAVGPFNIDRNVEENADAIRQAANGNRLVRKLVRRLSNSERGFEENRNPRCMLAIEIEFSGSSKHILGDYMNASMMGYIGLVVGPNERRFERPRDQYAMRKIQRIGDYVSTLVQVNKAAPGLFQNTIALEEDEFMRLCESCLPRRADAGRSE